VGSFGLITPYDYDPNNYLLSGDSGDGTLLTGGSATADGGGAGKLTQLSGTLKGLGLATQMLAGVGMAIGGYYAARTAQYEANSQASSLAFRSDMEMMNASRAEITAQSITEAGKNQVAAYTLQAGEQKAEATTNMAARGIALGVGSAATVAASMDIQKDLNVLAINSNATRQAWAARQQETEYQNQGAIDRVSAMNARRTADSISPVGSAVNSLLGSATQIAGNWNMNPWLRRKIAAGIPVPQIGIGVTY